MEPFPVNSYAHITRKTRVRNAFAAFALVGFVGGVYAWTYTKMRTNELTEIASELDEIRKERASIKPPTQQ